VIALLRAVRLGRITRKTLPKDVLSGVVVGVVAIPLAMAFAIACDLTPQQGLVTAILAGAIVSIAGGSFVQIAGPTGAFIVVLLGIQRDHGTAGLQVAGLLAGGILVLLGVTRLGRVVRFIPHPVTLGFTAGIAVIIFTSQVPDFLGLTLRENPREFVAKVRAIAEAWPTLSWHTLAVAGFTLLSIVAFPLVSRRIPPPLVGMGAGTALYLLWQPAGVATIGARFGEIPRGFPAPSLPDYDWSRVGELIGPAFAIAMLGAIESLLSAVVADGMTGDAHDPDQELVGQGLANLVTPLFGGFAATGAIARTATNVRNGGRSPVAGIVHSATVLLVVLFLAPYAAHVPLACLAAILFHVAWRMSEAPAVARLVRRGGRSDALVLLVTFGLTVFVDLVVAVEVGVVLAALLFVKKVSERAGVSLVGGPESSPDPLHGLAVPIPPQIALFSVDGPFFFGTSHRFEATLSAVDPRARVVVVRMWRVTYLDESGRHALDRVVHAFRRTGRRVVLAGVGEEVRRALEASEPEDRLDALDVWPDLEGALARAREIVTDEGLAAAAGGAPADPKQT
jgi:SulP family sulfate permease